MSLGSGTILAGQGDIGEVDLTLLPPHCVSQVVRRFCDGLAVELIGALVDGLNDKLLLSWLLNGLDDKLFLSWLEVSLPTLTKVQPCWVRVPRLRVP